MAQTTIGGVVKNTAGKPVSGAVVKIKNMELRLTYMVISQRQGRYTTPALRPGKYTAQAFGGVQQSEDSLPVAVGAGQSAKLDLSLNQSRTIVAPAKRVTTDEYVKMMPDGDGKKLILSRCVLCHGVERIVPKRATREQWSKTVDRMRYFLEKNRVPLSEQERDTLLDYVSTNFNRQSPPVRERPASGPNSNLPASLLAGAEARYTAMEFALPDGIWVHDIGVDSQGNAWFTERVSEVLGRFDAQSLTYEQFAPPAAKFRPELTALAVDVEDNVWLTDNGPNGLLLKYNPKAKAFKTYEIPLTEPMLSRNINMLRMHPDGSIWGTGLTAHRVLRFDPVTGAWRQFPMQMGSLPYGLVIGNDKSIWVSTHYGNSVEKLDPSDGKRTRFKMPPPNANLRRMQQDADGNLWVAGSISGKLLRLDPASGKITSYQPPTTDSGPFCIDVDTTRNWVWFGEIFADKLGRFDVWNNAFAEFPLPSADPGVEFSDAKVLWIEVDRHRPNRVWWAGGNKPRVGYIEVE